MNEKLNTVAEQKETELVDNSEEKNSTSNENNTSSNKTEPVKETEKSININIENIKEKEEPVKVNFKSGGLSSLKNFVGGKTKEHELAEDKEDEEKENEKPTNDDSELIGKYISEDEYKLIAKVLINLIDTVIVNIFKFWSGDTRETSYGLTKPKINELADILSKILKKRNVKWSLELLFVFMIVLGYAQNAKQAYEFRKDAQISKKNLKTVHKKVVIEDEEGNESEIDGNILEEKRGAKPKAGKGYVKHQRKSPRAMQNQELYDNAKEAA